MPVPKPPLPISTASEISTPSQKVSITLTKGEKIVKEFKPLSKLKWYFVISGTGGILIAFLVLWFLIPFIIFAVTGGRVIVLIVTFLILFLVMFGIAFLIGSLRYRWEYYWITNKRAIRRAGFIGYSHYSTPLERISDIIVTRGFWERIFGFGSVHLQTMAGQMTGGYSGRGSEIVFYASPNPENIQKTLFELVEEKRKREKLAF